MIRFIIAILAFSIILTLFKDPVIDAKSEFGSWFWMITGIIVAIGSMAVILR